MPVNVFFVSMDSGSGYLGLALKCTDLRLPLANLRSPWDENNRLAEHSYIGWVQNRILKISENTKLFDFRNISQNFVKQRILVNFLINIINMAVKVRFSSNRTHKYLQVRLS